MTESDAKLLLTMQGEALLPYLPNVNVPLMLRPYQHAMKEVERLNAQAEALRVKAVEALNADILETWTLPEVDAAYLAMIQAQQDKARAGMVKRVFG